MANQETGEEESSMKQNGIITGKNIQSPLVSVIIPVYNVLPYLREALDSVVNQTYRNLEIIIVDDGSTDGSAAVCDAYKKDHRVKVIHQENRGLSGARNTGLNAMTGEYIAFLDPDDAFCPEMIENMLQVIFRQKAEMAECGYDIRKTGRQLIKGRCIDRFRPEERVLTSEEALVLLLERRFAMMVWNKLYISRLWKNIRFPEGRVYEDVWVLPHILEECDCIAVSPQILVHHRVRKGSITQTSTIQNAKEHIEAIKMFQEYIENKRAYISNKSIMFYKENMLRSFIINLARLKNQRIPRNKLDVIKKEIIDLADKVELKQKKTKVVWWLFQHCPKMLLPVRACFLGLKWLRERRITE